MSKFNKKFQTKYKSDELKNWVSANILPNPMIGQVVNSSHWEGSDLILDTKIGHGRINISDYLVEIDFEFNIFGEMASRQIEDALDKEFKKLDS